MGFVVAKCQKCGYNMNIDDSLEKGFCPACGTPYIRDQLPKTGDTIAERIKSAEVFFTKLGDRNKAIEIFTTVTNDAPDDYRGWWGLVRVRTDNFENIEISRNDFNQISGICQNAFTIACSYASEEVQQMIEGIWNTYEKRYNIRLNNDKKRFQDSNQEITDIISALNAEISLYTTQIGDINFSINELNNQISAYRSVINSAPGANSSLVLKNKVSKLESIRSYLEIIISNIQKRINETNQLISNHSLQINQNNISIENL